MSQFIPLFIFPLSIHIFFIYVVFLFLLCIKIISTIFLDSTYSDVVQYLFFSF